MDNQEAHGKARPSLLLDVTLSACDAGNYALQLSTKDGGEDREELGSRRCAPIKQTRDYLPPTFLLGDHRGSDCLSHW